MAGYQLSADEIARSISKSPTQVRTWLRISRLPDDVLEGLESGGGGTQRVSGLAPRHIQPFVADIPIDATDNSPETAAKVDETISNVRQLKKELDERGVRINAHQADSVSRSVRAGKMTMTEAIDEVLANPDDYRYSARPLSPADVERDTWRAYRGIHLELNTLANKLRPEIAGSFAEPQRNDLLRALGILLESLEGYRVALERGPAGSAEQERVAITSGR